MITCPHCFKDQVADDFFRFCEYCRKHLDKAQAEGATLHKT